MANLTKEQIKQIIINRPEGTTPEGIIAGLRERGHNLEGYTEKTKQSTLSKVGGFLKETLNLPETILTTTAETFGRTIGGLSEGGLPSAKEEFISGIEKISKIPSQFKRGAEKGFFGETELPMPSDVLKLEGIGGLAVDIAGDPLNLIFMGGARKLVMEKSSKITSTLRKFGETINQRILNPKTKDEARQFEKLGRIIKEEIITEAETLGKNFSKYGITGKFKDMIFKMNQKIPKLEKTLQDYFSKTNEVLDISGLVDKLNDLKTSFIKIGKKIPANRITEILNSLKNQTKIPAKDAFELKRIYDDLITFGSKAKSPAQKMYKIVANGLRDKLNDLPTIGKTNKEYTTYIEAVKLFAKRAAETLQRGELPINITQFFPFIRYNPLSLIKTKTIIAKNMIDLSKILNIPLQTLKQGIRTIAPSTIKHLLDIEEEGF